MGEDDDYPAEATVMERKEDPLERITNALTVTHPKGEPTHPALARYQETPEAGGVFDAVIRELELQGASAHEISDVVSGLTSDVVQKTVSGKRGEDLHTVLAGVGAVAYYTPAAGTIQEIGALLGKIPRKYLKQAAKTVVVVAKETRDARSVRRLSKLIELYDQGLDIVLEKTEMKSSFSQLQMLLTIQRVFLQLKC